MEYKFNKKSILNFVKQFFCSLPWNQTTQLGWIETIIFSVFAAASYFPANYLFLSLFMAIGEFHKAFHALFEQFIQDIGTQKRKRLHAKVLTQPDLKASIRKLIDFHMTVKR